MKAILCFVTCFTICCASSAQMARDTTGDILKPQADLTIKASTIIKIENLGFRVNSELPELRPTVSADGNRLFFICENHPANTKYRSIRNSQDIWYSERDSTGKWQNARHMGYPLNTAHYNAVYWISPDNNKLLLKGSFVDGEYLGDGLSTCVKTKEGTWSKPQRLLIKN